LTIAQTQPIPTSAERLLLLRLQPATWRASARERELTGVDAESVVLTAAGIVATFRLTGKWTVSKLKSSDELVRAALMLPTSVRTTIRPGDIGGTAELTIRTRSPLDGADLRWTPDSVGIGRDEVTGDTVAVSPYQHRVYAGATGMGKSVLLRPIMAEVMRREDAAVVYLDPKRQEFSLWDGKIRVACEPETIYALAQEIVRALEYRQRHSAGATWAPTPEHPELVVIVDEGASLVRQSKTREYRDLLDLFEKIATMGRAARVWLHWCTQYPTKSQGIPPQVVEMMLEVISLAVKSPLTDRVVFGERAQRDGWEPSQLPQRPGYALVQANGRAPDPVRGWYMDDDTVRALPPALVWEGPPTANAVGQPDPLHRGAWMGQTGPWYPAAAPQRSVQRRTETLARQRPLPAPRGAQHASARLERPATDFGPRHRPGAGRCERLIDWLRPW
jgi:hypothetical protein